MTERILSEICAEKNRVLASVTCALDAGHSGLHKARAPNGGTYSWFAVVKPEMEVSGEEMGHFRYAPPRRRKK